MKRKQWYQRRVRVGVVSVVLFLLLATYVAEAKFVNVGLGKKHVLPTYQNYNTRAKKLGIPSFPTGGDVWPVAIYWTYLLVGTPPLPYPVAIDTGSSIMSIVGEGCDTCVKKPPNRVYKSSSSSTSQPVSCDDPTCGGDCSNNQCTFSQTYATCDLKDPNAPCTISGLWFSDLVTVGSGIKPVSIDFGTITFQTSNFDQFQNIDGLVGLIQSGPNDPTDVFLSLFEAGSVPQNIFAMCLLMQPGPGGSNGTITFGGIDSTLYTGAIQWTPNTNQGYSMSLQSLNVFGKHVTEVASEAILDSGTNVLLLPDDAFNAVAEVFYQSCSNGSNLVGICNVPRDQSLFNGKCYPLTSKQVAAYPNITLEFPGAKISMAPSTYLNLYDTQSPNPLYYCLGIRNTGPGGITIIGDTSMAAYYVIFDNVNNRIGWANVNLKTCGSQPLSVSNRF
eukprot:TRINITY_DN1535_c0_g1_i4.p1 TRINITY_DN1535_c0_g1~~TRINITY_DN1535_c0_g1_i4.p1  ORF type:complete len:446 (-),score=86.50 TRINITY_DN1535_c0_g1_i4:108-1445(-)